MRHWAIAMGVVGLAAAAMMIGCESNSPPEEAEEYDPQVDAWPTNLQVTPDENLVANQATVAGLLKERAAGPGASGKGGTSGGGAEDATVTEVRTIVGAMVVAVKGDDMVKVFESFTDEDRSTLAETIAAYTEMPRAMTAFEKAVKDTLGMKEPPASLTQSLAQAPPGAPGLIRLKYVAAEDLTYNTDGEVVTVTGGGVNLSFEKIDDAWKVQLSDEQKKVMAALGGLLKAQTDVVTTLTGSIADGGLTEHNLDAKGLELLEEKVQPELEKLKAVTEGGSAP